MELYKGQLKNYDFKSHCIEKRKHRKNAKKQFYSTDVFSFDTESTSAWRTPEGDIILYEPGKPSKYWNSLEPLSICYLWIFSVNDKVYYGRELNDFIALLQDIPEDVHIIIWVHNLAWDAHFLFNVLHKLQIFARTPHKPMKITSGDFQNIEFHCSYFLTRLSLDSWGKSIGFKKLTGTVDYNVMRTPFTPLDADMLNYAEADVLVIYHGIKAYLKRYDTVWDIPLTQTGTVRRVIKDLLTSDPAYVKRIKKLVPRNAKEYLMLRRVFAGGYTHANRLHSKKVITGLITHFDFASSYPTQMIAQKYPCTPWIYTGSFTLPDESLFEEIAFILHLRFTGIECIKWNSYIQWRKCNNAVNFTCDNGRLLSAASMDIWITEQDYLIIKQMYKWEKVEVLAKYQSIKKYLPTPFVKYILELYQNKTTLKLAPEGSAEADLYAQSKQYINSLFGMSVTALVMSDINFIESDLEWSMEPLTREKIDYELDKLRSWSPREKRYFLNYSWGCWITAYARKALFDCMLYGSNDSDTIYADTDSLFLMGEKDFTWYNNAITEKLLKALEYHGIEPEAIAPKDPKGTPHPLGHFTEEPRITEFCTTGAKRYVERRAEDGKMHLTISGINKGAVAVLNDDIYNFKEGLSFDKDHPSVNKKLHTYIDNQEVITWPDGYVSTDKSGINLRPNGYKMTMPKEYNELIEMYEDIDIDTLPESFYNHLRGVFL